MRLLLVVPLWLICAAGAFERSSSPDAPSGSPLAAEQTRQGFQLPPTPQPDPVRPLPPGQPQPVTPAQIVRSSGMIFSGTVVKVEHHSESVGHPTVTQITFQVQDALRGTRRGEALRVREWSGLWNMGERYHTGETVFLFLYPPSKLGLTSPVAGAAGKFPVRDGRIIFGPQHIFFKPTAGNASIAVKEFVTRLRRAGGD